MLDFDVSYFEEEIIEGFTVPAFMKHAWAAELEMLNKVDTICRENDIQYFANWGTLLGTVRHKGIIPWDDDIDLCMIRDDLEKFAKVVGSYEDIQLITNYNTPDHGMNAARVMNGTMFTVDRNMYKKFYGFPFPAGLDIFYLDYVPREKSLENEQVEVLRKISEVIHIMEWLDENKPSSREYSQLENQRQHIIRWLENTCSMHFSQKKPTKQEILILANEVQGLYGDDDSDYITEFACLGVGMDYYIPKDVYAESIRMPFMNTTIPIPKGYDFLLRKKYGDDYMTPCIYTPGHDYPFYKVFIEAIFDENKHKTIEGTTEYVENISAKFYREFLTKESTPAIEFNDDELKDDLSIERAAKIEVLEEVKRICNTTGIELFALGDTLEGAVKYEGFCPEKDDIHLGIRREQLSDFLFVLPQELDSWFNYSSLYSVDNHEDMRIFVFSDSFMCDSDEFKNRFHGCSKSVGIDISVIDVISDDEEEDEVRKTLVEKLIITSKNMPSNPPYSREILKIVDEWQKIVAITINVEANLRREFLKAADNIAATVQDDKAKRIRVTAGFQDGKDITYSRKDFDGVVELPFGKTTITVPVGYENIIKK